MINKYGRRSKFGMKGRCSHLPLAGGTFQECPALIAHAERCCGFILTMQSPLKGVQSSSACWESNGDRWAGGSHLCELLWAQVWMCGFSEYITASTGCPEELWVCSLQLCIVFRTAGSRVKSVLWTWWCTGCAGGTEGCEIGLSSLGKAGAATLFLSLSEDWDAAVTSCPYWEGSGVEGHFLMTLWWKVFSSVSWIMTWEIYFKCHW